jgi:hypothetical protein
MQVEGLLDQLCAAAVPHAPTLPLLSQATLSLALAQLEFYDSALVTTLADAVKEALAPPTPATGSSGSSSSSSSVPQKAPALQELPEGLVSGVLLSMAVACSLNRHYDPELLDRLADQVGFRCSWYGSREEYLITGGHSEGHPWHVSTSAGPATTQ